MSYVELHTASAFSFLQGASLPEAIVDRAAELGYHSIALLDRDGVYGIPRFHKAACAAGIRPLIGAELTITLDSQERAGPAAKNAPFVLPLLCESAEGYRNLCRLITRMKLASPTSLRQGYGGPPELQRRRKRLRREGGCDEYRPHTITTSNAPASTD